MDGVSFSVLISVYNKETSANLDKSLESVFNQTIMPTEVVLIEDGKLNDKLDKIVNKYCKSYPKIMRVIKFKENRGLGIALHDGLLKCKHEIVFRMDSDDVCTKKRFEKTLNIFSKMDVDVVGSNIVEYDDKMIKVTGYRNVPETNDRIVKTLKTRNPFNHMTVAYKKSKVMSSGNYLDMPFFEDYYLWARMYVNNSKFYNIQEYLVKVRGGNEMIKRRGGKKYIKPILNFQKYLLKLKIINIFEFLFNATVRISVSLIPEMLRTVVYRNFLRKKGGEDECIQKF